MKGSSRMDAGTYYVLYNLRILISGLITQIIFRKTLGGLKWFALILLVVVPLLPLFIAVQVKGLVKVRHKVMLG